MENILVTDYIKSHFGKSIWAKEYYIEHHKQGFAADLIEFYNDALVNFGNNIESAYDNAELALDSFAQSCGFKHYYHKDFEKWIEEESSNGDYQKYCELYDALSNAEDAKDSLSDLEHDFFELFKTAEQIEVKNNFC